MAVFDIGHIITRSDGVFDRDRGKNLIALTDWLSENVGEYYGSGEDYTDKEKNVGSESIRIGSGWQITKDWKGDPDGYVEIWWKLDITDDAKSTLFALKWIN